MLKQSGALNRSESDFVLDVGDARDIYKHLFHPFDPEIGGGALLRSKNHKAIDETERSYSCGSLCSISLGSLNLLTSPIYEAFIRNTTVFAAFGFRMRPDYDDAKLEVLEHLRLTAVTKAPFWVRSEQNSSEALVMGTLVLTPYPSHHPLEQGIASFNRSLNRNWKMSSACLSIFLCDQSEWLKHLPENLKEAAKSRLNEHTHELEREVNNLKQEDRVCYDPSHLSELTRLGLVTEEERRECIESLHYQGFIKRIDS